MNSKKIALLLGFLAFVACFFVFDLQQYLNLEYLKLRQNDIKHYFSSNPIQTGAIFFSIYVIVTSISLPGAGILTIAAGAIFGTVWGSVLVSFASVLGATIAFLISRYLFHDLIQTRFSKQLKPINRGVEREGSLYLFTVRLVPVFPFFIINIVMALTPIKTFTFAWVSQIGMLIPTIIFVNAGTQLAQIESAGDILSLELILSFVLLGVFPIAAKKTLDLIKKKNARIAEEFETETDV